MSYRTFRIIFVCVALMLMISFFSPYERFNIAIEYSTIIRIIIGVAVIGMSIRLALYIR